jgi:hypothetical protein
VHISRHLPTDVVSRLEGLFKINSLEELGEKIREARLLYDETVQFLQFGSTLPLNTQIIME